MAGFKKINGANPTIRRPLRMSDIQDLWDGLGSMLGLTLPENTPYIVSGFELSGDGTVMNGVLVYNNRLYACTSNTTVGATMFLREVPDAARVFAKGQPQVFSYSCDVSEDSTNAVAWFVVTESWLANNRVTSYVKNGSITTAKLAEASVTSPKIGLGVTSTIDLGARQELPIASNPLIVGAKNAYGRFSVGINPNQRASLAIKPEALGDDSRGILGEYVLDVENLVTSSGASGDSASLVVEVINSNGSVIAEAVVPVTILSTPTTTRIRVGVTSSGSIRYLSYESVNLAL